MVRVNAGNEWCSASSDRRNRSWNRRDVSTRFIARTSKFDTSLGIWTDRWNSSSRTRRRARFTSLEECGSIDSPAVPKNAAEDSYDISAALRGTPDKPIREALVMQNCEGVFAIRQGPWKYVAAGIADGAPKMSPWTKEGQRAQLYNLQDDPREERDVIAANGDVAERLAKLLKQYRDQGHSWPMP